MNYSPALNNFEMEEDFRKILDEKIDNLLEVSPSDAAARSKITKTKTGYHGVLQIFSSQGKFIAKTAACNLDDLTKSLFQLMYRKIKKWRSCRFIA